MIPHVINVGLDNQFPTNLTCHGPLDAPQIPGHISIAPVSNWDFIVECCGFQPISIYTDGIYCGASCGVKQFDLSKMYKCAQEGMDHGIFTSVTCKSSNSTGGSCDAPSHAANTSTSDPPVDSAPLTTGSGPTHKAKLALSIAMLLLNVVVA